jgi:hypothetical protein
MQVLFPILKLTNLLGKLHAQAASRTAATNALEHIKSGYTLGNWAQPAHACTRYYHLVGDCTHTFGPVILTSLKYAIKMA